MEKNYFKKKKDNILGMTFSSRRNPALIHDKIEGHKTLRRETPCSYLFIYYYYGVLNK